MSILAGQTYKYSPLPSATSIRLLQIISDTGDPLICSLNVFDLSEEPIYDCLSYTWGDPLYHELSGPEYIRRTSDERHISITCDGSIIYITENLYEALLRLNRKELSLKDSHRRQGLIWIDAVCIDQDNMPERSSQVVMMSRIYMLAQAVIVWLGISDTHIENAIEVMNRLSSVPPKKYMAELPEDLDDPEICSTFGISYIEPQQWLDYAAFLQRTWFSRIWVIQETFVAQNITVFCGSEVLVWSDIAASSRLLKETTLATLLTRKVFEAINPSITSSIYVGDNLANPFIFQRMRESAGSLNLEKLLTYSRYFNATNARDHLFALLGMWEQSLVHKKMLDHIQPDYEMTVNEVFTVASWAAIRETGDLNLLSLIENDSLRKLYDLPSWVPDYSVTPKIYPLITNVRVGVVGQRWRASGELVWSVPLQINSHLLPVQGIYVDSIVEFAATESDIVDMHEIKSLLELLKHYLHEGQYKGILIDHFWRTLIKDTYREQPANEEARSAFSSLITVFVWELQEALSIAQDTLDSADSELSPFDPHQPDLKLAQLSKLHSQTKALILSLSTRDLSGTIPSWENIQRMIKNNDLDRSISHIGESFHIAYNGRRLFRTNENYIGISAQGLMKGDSVWVLAGAAVPMVLRHLPDGNWRLIGEAYVHSIMNGEVTRADNVKMEQICLE